MEDERIVKKLMTSVKCGVCGQSYMEDNVSVIEHTKELWFLRVFCPACHTRCLVAAIIKEEDRGKAISDLTEAEENRLADADAVGVDDVLDMHNFLKDFEGDLPRLFKRK